MSRPNISADNSVFRRLSVSINGAELRTDTYRDEEFIVCPVISMVGDRVIHSANAPTAEFVPASVLEIATESRNNRPVVMSHPQVGGEYVSANTPDLLEKYCFGYVFNTAYDPDTGKVHVEAWLSRAMAEKVGPDAVDAIDRIESGEMVEVSEGNIVVIENESGIGPDGKEYGARWLLAVSDHLAFLPDGVEGACSIADQGCGALRTNADVDSGSGGSGNVVRSSALSQARTPTYTGTESVSWSTPSFSVYIKYLHEGAPGTGPKTVSQCSADLKRRIASHSLLGDPDASNIRELTLFACVNPANGKLNEKALRSILGSKGSTADIPEKAKASAQDMARRLLNSEFGISASASASASRENSNDANSDVNDDNGEDEMNKTQERSLKHIIASMSSSMSSFMDAAMSGNLLRARLLKAIKKIEPLVSFVQDEDVSAGTVLYCVWSDYSYNYNDYRWYQRTFSTDSKGNVTINDDRIEMQYAGEKYEPITTTISAAAKGDDMPKECDCEDPDNCTCDMDKMKNMKSKDDEDEMDDDDMMDKKKKMMKSNQQKGDKKMAVKMDQRTRAATISRIVACCKNPYTEKDIKALEGFSDETLVKLDTRGADAAETEAAPVPAVPAPVQGTVVASSETVVKDAAKDVKNDVKMVTIPESEFADIKAAAAAFKAQQKAQKDSLVSRLKDASAFTPAQLEGMELSILEGLARTLKLETSTSSTSNVFDYSGARVAAQSPDEDAGWLPASNPYEF